MAETLKTLASLFRSLVTLALLGIVSACGWIGYQTVMSRSNLVAELHKREAELQERDAAVAKLKEEVAAQTERIEQLDLSLRLLKSDHRLAQITVLDQWESPDKKQMTKFQFVDVDDEDRPIDKPRDFTIEGDIVYIEAWVVKYLDQFVETGDLLRGTSICLFKRLWGEHQEPSEGFVLDAVDSRPAAYGRGGEMPEFEKKIWANFWEFANEPDKAQLAGIRVAHGEAPFIKLRPGKAYLLKIRASGGLEINAKDEAPSDGKQL